MATYRLTKGSQTFPWHVVDERGMPHDLFTLFACEAASYHSPNTARAYTRAVVYFASWASIDPIVARQGWDILGVPDGVRRVVSHFLTTKLKCVVVLQRNKLGFETRRVEANWDVKRSIPHLLAALKSFYNILHSNGKYGDVNPMEGDGAAAIIATEKRSTIRGFAEKHGRNPMPSVSGIDQVRCERLSAAYFRLRDGEWMPTYLDDPTLFNEVLTAGEIWGWQLRETSVCRTLFDSGCRIHEACALTVADWQKSDFGKSVEAINKGSYGLRGKTLYLTDRTVKVLRRYFDGERRAADGENRGVAEFSLLPAEVTREIPLFLTSRGTALTPDHFRRNYWTPALAASGIRIRPHQVRHWFVTTALKEIEARSRSPEELQTERAALRQLMAWKSDMLPIYDQAIRKNSLPTLAARIHAQIEVQQSAPRVVTPPTTVKANLDTELSLMLDAMLGS